MYEDRRAVVKVHDAHAIDVFVDNEVWDALVKMERATNDGIAFRSKRHYPREIDECVCPLLGTEDECVIHGVLCSALQSK